MKRDAYGDDGPTQKRQRQTDDEVTFLIPSKVAGSIIGKGGVNISKLRSQPVPGLPAAPAQRRRAASRSKPAARGRDATRRYSKSWLPVPSDAAARPAPPRHAVQYKASITVPDCPGPERVLSIQADDIDTVLEIVKDILPNLADGGSGPNKGNSQPTNEDLGVRLLIHQSRAGCVIGKGGAKIKELREKTGARLKIFSNPAPQSTERVVQLFGKAEAVAAGVREVLDLVRQVPIKGGIQPYDPHNYDDFYAEEYGGFGGGGGAPGGGGMRRPPRTPPRPPQSMGAPPRGPPPRGPMGRGPPPPPRPPAFHDFPGPAPGPPPRNFGGSGGPPRGFGGGGFGGGFGGHSGGGGAPVPPAFGPPNGAPTGQRTSTQVTIPKDLAGAIIGKAGSRIRKIRNESGAGIEIAEPLPGSSDRIITITGTPHRIQLAQYLLQQSVHESNPNLGGGGGGRGNF